jgi:hypothetical protein
MHNITVEEGEIIEFETAFPGFDLYQHGRDKVGIEGSTSVCVHYKTGGHLLERADWDSGDSGMGATMGGNRNIVIADTPFALPDDDGVLGVVEYRQGVQPSLKVNGEVVEGGSNRFSSFVSETGDVDEDPKPRSVSDIEGQREVNRETGQAVWTDYYVHAYRLDDYDGILTLQTSGHTPETDTTYPEPD